MPLLAVRLDMDSHMSSQEHRELASLAEKSGYETVWVPEGGGRDALTQLTAIAMTTQRIKLGTGILPVFSRTPMLTAMSAAGLAAVSNGRFILGLGVGHRPAVEDGHGVTFRRPLARLRETITIVRRLLRGESVTHRGRVFRVHDAGLGEAAPAEPVPIYIAALGPRMLELGGEVADGVLLNWTATEYLREAVEHVRRGAAKAGRDPSEIVIAGYVRVAVEDDPDAIGAARASLQRQIARYAGMSYYRKFFDGTGFQREMAAAEQALERGDAETAYSAITPDMQDEVAVVGTAEHCRRELEKRRSLGLQLPVVAPFPVGDDRTSYRQTIEALGQQT